MRQKLFIIASILLLASQVNAGPKGGPWKYTDTTTIAPIKSGITVDLSGSNVTFPSGGNITGTSINITGDADIGGEATVVGNITGASVTTSRSATPGISAKDSDCADDEVTGTMYYNATATNTTVEVGDYTNQVKGGQGTPGTLATFDHFDASAQRRYTYGIQSFAGIETVTCASNTGTAAVTKTISLIVTDGGADTNEDTVGLADGVAGDIKIFVYMTETDVGDSANVTPTNGAFTKILFEDPGDGCIMIFNGTNWTIVANNGGTIS